METFKLLYYETKEHFESDVSDELDETFYSKKGVISKAHDLLYRKLYFKIIIYSSLKESPIYSVTFSRFNRKDYKENKIN